MLILGTEVNIIYISSTSIIEEIFSIFYKRTISNRIWNN